MKRHAWWMLLFAVCVFGPMAARAQNEGVGINPQKAPEEKPLQQFQFYKLNFALRELEDGKVLNTRNFVTNMRSQTPDSGNAEASVRSGTRVAIQVSPSSTQYNYQDVGVNIDCRMERPDPRGPSTALRISMDITSIAPAEGGPAPAIRSVRGSNTVPFVLDKPILVTSVDDLTSKRQYQLEVTITKK